MERIKILKTVKENMEELEEVHSEEEVSETEENVIVKSFSQNENRVDISSMLSVILAQREIDQKRIISLYKKISEMDSENSKLDSRLHYTKMDLVNAEIKIETLVKELQNEKDLHKKLAEDKQRFYMILLWFCIIVSKISFLLFLR